MGSWHVSGHSVGRYMISSGVMNSILESSGSKLVALLLSHQFLTLLVTLVFETSVSYVDDSIFESSSSTIVDSTVESSGSTVDFSII